MRDSPVPPAISLIQVKAANPFNPMTEGTYGEGYCDGRRSAAGDEPLPSRPTRPPPGDAADCQAGFAYGRADTLAHHTPGTPSA